MEEIVWSYGEKPEKSLKNMQQQQAQQQQVQEQQQAQQQQAQGQEQNKYIKDPQTMTDFDINFGDLGLF